jgi:hypothetical protein
MKINYELTLEDCKDYANYVWKIPRVRKYLLKSILKPALVIIAIAAIGGIIIINMDIYGIMAKHNTTYTQVVSNPGFFKWLFFEHIITFVIVIAIFVVLVVVVGFFENKVFGGKRTFKQLKGTVHTNELTISEKGLEFKNAAGISNMFWEKIVDIHDTGKSFLIFLGDYMAHIVPKRAFNSETEADEFYNLMQKYHKYNKIAVITPA